MIAGSQTSAERVRAGGTVLSLIAEPLTVPILHAHREEALRLPDLRERIDGAAQTTLRGQVGKLRDVGALERHVRSGMPYTVENELADTGLAILAVAEIVDTWLTRAPQGAIALGSEPAKWAIRALIGGWDSAMLHALATQPLSLTELSSMISELSYPALERRLSAMRATHQVEPSSSGEGRAKPYAVTEWARQAVGPLIAACRCECLHLPGQAAPLTRIDIEAAFLLAVPLVDLEVTRRGSCLLAVDTGAPKDGTPPRRIASLHVDVEGGTVISCVSRLEQEPGTWAVGTVGSWVELILEGSVDRLRLGGESPSLANGLVRGLHASLFSPES